jgi:hypothetical protein
MSLEANKFLSRLYGEAVANQQGQDREIKEKVKQVALREVGKVMADVDMSQQDYQFFRRKLNDFSYDLFNIQSVIAENIPSMIIQSVANAISHWNQLVSSLARLKYNKLKFSDKTIVKNNLNELKPTLSQISSQLDRLGVDDDTFSNLQKPIDKILLQINSDNFDQVSYPLKEEVDLLEDDEEEEDEEDEDEDEDEEDD